MLLCGCRRNEELSGPALSVCLCVNISVVTKAIHGIKFHTCCHAWRAFPLSWLKMMLSQAILWPLSEGTHQARIFTRSHCFSATVLRGDRLSQPIFLLTLVYIMNYNLYYHVPLGCQFYQFYLYFIFIWTFRLFLTLNSFIQRLNPPLAVMSLMLLLYFFSLLFYYLAR